MSFHIHGVEFRKSFKSFLARDLRMVYPSPVLSVLTLDEVPYAGPGTFELSQGRDEYPCLLRQQEVPLV